jgi:hypothetical protein
MEWKDVSSDIVDDVLIRDKNKPQNIGRRVGKSY